MPFETVISEAGTDHFSAAAVTSIARAAAPALRSWNQELATAVEPPVPWIGPISRLFVELRIGGSEGHAHARPVGIEFVGQDGGETRRIALPHIQMLDQHGDGVVGGDPHEGVGLSRGGGEIGPGRRGAPAWRGRG